VQIDPRTNEVVTTIPLGMRPFALAVHQGTLWVTSRLENSVMRVDVTTHEVVATISDVKDPSVIAVTDDAVWIANHSDDSITRIDPVTNEIVALIPLEVTRSLNPNCGSCVSGITIDANAVWVSIAVGGIARIDPQTNQVVAKLITGPGTYGIASEGQAVWFTNATEQAILRIDPQTNTITGSIPSSATLSFLASGNGVLWATTDMSEEQAPNQVLRFDLQP
jgi:streptogramin lyase